MKPDEERILIFGASGHIGGPLARFIAYQGYGAALRLATSDETKLQRLRDDFPKSECISVSYLDRAGMARALEGVDRVFVVTPDFLDEKTAMANLVHAAQKGGRVKQIVRIVGDPPGMRLDKISPALRAFGRGTAIQHLQAREVLDASELPVTYLNIAAYLMDDFLRWSGPIRSRRIFLMPFDRVATWIDPGELGEAAARILLSRDDRHLHRHYDLNNGSDLVTFGEVAGIISDVLQEPVKHEASPKVWRELMGERYRALYGAGADDYFLEYYAFEQRNQFAFHRSDVLQRMLGRTPKTLRAWLEQHADRLR